ncbi:WD40_repeat protein [Hexamita inflata]|uniref:WD40 repeat protein n=1 Tax=Hexamita inflata TaxID=28002 RepID=A0AA86UYI7_9EUKA|nr:WD40 repeat protein [Hexamita inflata]
MSITTHLSEPVGLLKHLYTGGTILVEKDIMYSFNKNFLNKSTLPQLCDTQSILVSETPEDILTSLTLDREHNQIICFSKSAKGFVIDMNTFTVTSQFSTAHQQMITLSAFHSVLATTAPDHTVRLYNDQFIQTKAIKTQSIVIEMKWATATKLIVICQQQSFIFDYLTQTVQPIEDIVPTTVCVISNTMLLFSSRDNNLNLVDIASTPKLITQVFVNEYYFSLLLLDNFVAAISHKGNLLFIDLNNFDEVQKSYCYERIYNSVHPGDNVLMQLSQQRTQNSEDEWPQEQEEVSQNVFMQLNMYQIEDSKILLITDAENVIYQFDLATLQIVNKQMHITLLKANLGDFGEILAIKRYNEDWLTFCCSTNKLVLLNLKTSEQRIILGQKQPLTHIEIQETIYGKLLVTVAMDSINFYFQQNETEIVSQTHQESLGLIFENAPVSFKQEPLHFINMCQIEPDQKQIHAVTLLAQDTRQILAFSQEKQIKMIEMTKILMQSAENKHMNLIKVQAEKLQTAVTAHLDTINDLRFTNKFLLSASTDKSIALWSYNKQIKQAQEEKITVFDIFTNKVNKRFQLAIDRTNTQLQLIKQMPSVARRTNWGVSINKFENTFAVASGDHKVRIFMYKDEKVQLIKTFEDFNAQVVRCEFINQGEQLLCLQIDGILKLINVRAGEVAYTKNVGDSIKKELSDFWFKASYKKENVEDVSVEFSTWGWCFDTEAYVGCSNGQIYQIQDDTLLQEQLKLEERNLKIQNEQLFLISMNNGQYEQALLIAIEQDNEKQALRLFEKLHQEHKYSIDLKTMKLAQIKVCLKYVKNWLRNTKRSQCGIELFHSVLESVQAQVLKDIGCQGEIDEIKLLLGKQVDRLESMLGQCLLLEWM